MAETDRDAALMAELEKLERSRLDALVTADLAAAEALHADDYQLITPGGVSLSKEEYLGPISTGTFTYRRFEPDGEIAVRLLGPGAAALRYRAVIDVDFPGGHEIGRYWHTDIYVRRDGRWLVVWSHATRIPGEYP